MQQLAQCSTTHPPTRAAVVSAIVSAAVAAQPMSTAHTAAPSVSSAPQCAASSDSVSSVYRQCIAVVWGISFSFCCSVCAPC
eukprot:2185-Heterococcus_DN1.PRE.3